MAKVQKRTWLGRGPTGHKVKRIAWGHTLQAGGKQERKFSADWTRDDAQQALATRLLERDAPSAPAVPKTLSQVAQEYLAYKRGKGKRSIRQDEQILTKLKARLGAEAPIVEITSQRIAQSSGIAWSRGPSSGGRSRRPPSTGSSPSCATCCVSRRSGATSLRCPRSAWRGSRRVGCGSWPRTRSRAF